MTQVLRLADKQLTTAVHDFFHGYEAQRAIFNLTKINQITHKGKYFPFLWITRFFTGTRLKKC